MKPYSFPKAEHLCSRKDIDALFSSGNYAASAFPLRAVYRRVPRTAGPAVKVLLSVSKRRHKLAVDRNRAKRQLREAYRHHKSLLAASLQPDESLHLAFLWLSNRPVPSATVENRVKNLLHRIAEKINADGAPRPATANEQMPAQE